MAQFSKMWVNKEGGHTKTWFVPWAKNQGQQSAKLSELCVMFDRPVISFVQLEWRQNVSLSILDSFLLSPKTSFAVCIWLHQVGLLSSLRASTLVGRGYSPFSSNGSNFQGLKRNPSS